MHAPVHDRMAMHIVVAMGGIKSCNSRRWGMEVWIFVCLYVHVMSFLAPKPKKETKQEPVRQPASATASTAPAPKANTTQVVFLLNR